MTSAEIINQRLDKIDECCMQSDLSWLTQTIREMTAALNVSRAWYDEIYPEDVFIDGSSADSGVNRVVKLRMITQNTLDRAAGKETK